VVLNFNERVVIPSLSHYPCAWAQGQLHPLHGGDDLSNKEKSTTFAADSGIRNSVGGIGYGSTLILLLDQ
jgi:hypothetical protein